ncbi:MAG: T9SS type A sorting domain-containing protein [Dysgonamonadaceae bacterium]|jgi:polygalacturonase|nr:T9SS type A sorting domain-containing protein [Dysgonamonadaceae bacterium]
MKTTKLVYRFAVLSFFFAVSFNASGAKVASYPLPFCYTESDNFQVSVSGIKVPVSKTWNVYEYAHYSFEGQTTITITAKQDIQTFSISSPAYNIQGTKNGKTLTFELNRSLYLIIKINSLPELVIAADEWETDVPASSGEGIYNVVNDYGADPLGENSVYTAMQNAALFQQAIDDANAAGGGIVYVPSGVYYTKSIILKSNVHLYLASGAVIRGTGRAADYQTLYYKSSISNYPGSWLIYTDGPIPVPTGTNRSLPVEQTTNIKIYGRGTIDANGDAARKDKMLLAQLMPMNTENFTVDGITFRDSGLWGVTVTRSNDVNFLNVKFFNENNANHEDDAIDINESQRVLVKHSIAISEDDTYSTKTWDNWAGELTVNWTGPAEELNDVVFDDCVAWSRCAAFKVGFGVYQHQSNIVFKNSTVYKCMRALAVNHKYKPKNVTNVVFDNIDIEGYWARSGSEYMQRWFELDFSDNSDGGYIDGVTIRNINVRNVGTVTSVLKGLNANTKAKNITFENIYMPGQTTPATTLDQMNIKNRNNYLENVQIVSTGATVIKSAADLNNIRNNPDGNYKLTADIDLTDWIDANSPAEGWMPIDNFTGTLDGNNHFITGLWVDRTANNAGLFGNVAGEVQVKNLGIKTAEGKSVKGGENVGILIGRITNSETTNRLLIENCAVFGNAEGSKSVGAMIGLVNWATVTIENSYAAGTIVSTGDGAGGLIGSSWGNVTVRIEKSYSANSVKASSANGSTGGLFGSASANNASGINLTITNCYAINPNIDSSTANRILGWTKAGANITLGNNYGYEQTLVKGNTVDGNLTGNNGENTSKAALKKQETYSNWNFPDVWSMNGGDYFLPVLKTLNPSSQPDSCLEHLKGNAKISILPDEKGVIAYLPAQPEIDDDIEITITPQPQYNLSKFYINDIDKTSGVSGNKFTLHIENTNYTLKAEYDDYNGSGKGTKNSPYIIYNVEQLNYMRNHLNSCYRLGANIDLQSTLNSTSEGWLPIGTTEDPFTGGFDGNRFVISNIWINRENIDNTGFFGSVSGSAVIENLGIIVPEGKSIKGKNHVGGVAGNILQTNPDDSVTIRNCYVTAFISGDNFAGGIAGFAESATVAIENCYAGGKVTTAGNASGGLFGSSAGKTKLYIKNSYSLNTVETAGTGVAGGIFGLAEADDASEIFLFISNSKAINPEITGNTVNRIYGFAKQGAHINLVNNTVFSGMLLNGAEAPNLPDETGQSRAELKSQENYPGWDFSRIWQMGNRRYPLPVLRSGSLVDYRQTLCPAHMVEPFSGEGNGASEQPYVITTSEQLREIENNLALHYRLGNNIDLTEWITNNSPVEGWKPLGDEFEAFSGSLDGAGYSISELWIDLSNNDNVGLFACAGGNAVIKNLALKTASSKSVKGKNAVGALIGFAPSGNIGISNSYVDAKIEALEKNAGGFTGYSKAELSIENCYVLGSVTVESDRAGGFVGLAENTALNIKNSYAANEIMCSNGSAGGLLGSINGTSSILKIEKCAAINLRVVGSENYTGRIIGFNAANNTTLSNFALANIRCNSSETVKTQNNKNGLDKSGNEMVTQNTYSNGLDWNFGSVWKMSNDSYPLPILQSINPDNQPKIAPSHLAGFVPLRILQPDANNMLTVYPNPTQGELQINKKTIDAEVLFFDCTGKLVLQTNDTQLNIGNLTSGIYILQSEGQRVKVIKSK